MLKISALTSYLDELLEVSEFKDYCPNGLQVSGSPNVSSIVSGVSACQELFQKAIAIGADTILVHHGFFWQGENPCITSVKRERILMLLENNINLLAYHLPLDFNKVYGNNIQLAKILNIKVTDDSQPIFLGKLKKPLGAEEFCLLLEKKLLNKPLVVNGGKHKIDSIAWSSGAAADHFELAAQKGVDAFLTGEVNERSFYLARELGVHLIAAGHYATERYGVQAIGDHLAEKFGITQQFVEIDNPL